MGTTSEGRAGVWVMAQGFPESRESMALAGSCTASTSSVQIGFFQFAFEPFEMDAVWAAHVETSKSGKSSQSLCAMSQKYETSIRANAHPADANLCTFMAWENR